MPIIFVLEKPCEFCGGINKVWWLNPDEPIPENICWTDGWGYCVESGFAD